MSAETVTGRCHCGWLFARLDEIRQPEHVGFRYIGESGKVYCSRYCAERRADVWPSADGWFPLAAY